MIRGLLGVGLAATALYGVVKIAKSALAPPGEPGTFDMPESTIDDELDELINQRNIAEEGESYDLVEKLNNAIASVRKGRADGL